MAPVHSSRLFGHDKAKKQFLAMISDLPRPAFGQVYQDACDIGFSMISQVSGKEAMFFVDEQEYQNNGDLTCWILRPTKETAKRYPLIADWSVVVFND